METSDNNQIEIEGDVQINALGVIRVSMTLENTPIAWLVEPQDDCYFIALPDMNTKVKISDKISCKVEGTSLLRDRYSFKEETLELMKELIDEAWVPPRIAKAKVIQLVKEYNESGW